MGLAAATLLCAGASTAGDRGADGRFDTRTSAHFNLHQDVDIDQSGGFHGSRRFEQTVLAELERAYESLDRLLGLRPNRKIDVVIYDTAVFDQSFRGLFRFTAAGFYHGVIRIRGATEMTVALRRVLHHELVHAGLDAAAPSYVYPGWFNEGMAEWFEARALGKRGLNGTEWAYLTKARKNGGLFSYQQLMAPGFGGLDQQRAQLAYLQSYAMIDFLARSHGERRLPEVVNGLVRSRNLDRTLRRVYRADLSTLEARLFAELS